MRSLPDTYSTKDAIPTAGHFAGSHILNILYCFPEGLQQPQNEIILTKFFSFLNKKYRVEQGLPIKVGVALPVLDIFAESPKSCVSNCDKLRGQNLRPFLHCVQ